MPWTNTNDGRSCRRCGSTDAEFYESPKTGRVGYVCRACSRKGAPKRTPAPAPQTVTITNSCGHEYTYRIKRKGAEEWLKKQPCPKCRHGMPGTPTPTPAPDQEPPEEPTPDQTPTPDPEPTPEPEADEDWVAAMMELLPEDGLFHRVFLDVLRIVRAGPAVWLQGPPGTSKSTMGQQVAAALGLDFYSVSCYPLMSRTDLFGYEFNGTDHRTPLWDAYEKGGLFLIDEIDNGNSALTAALNSALANGHAVFGSGTTVQMHPDFRCVASANTDGLGPEAGFIGREGVDLATRDRFVTVYVPIDDVLEAALASIVFGEDLTPYRDELIELVRDRLRAQSVQRQKEDTTPAGVLAAVRQTRQRVTERFDRVVVSPRMTLHASTLVREGFTVREAIAAKLVGLKPDQIETVVP